MSQKRILLIDNETTVREVVRACLKDLGGWEVLEAASLQDGLLKARTEQLDAVVLELMLPEGWTLLAQLHAEFATQAIPIVLLTAKATWIPPQQWAQFGVRGAIAKPFDPVLLPRQIADACGWEEGIETVA
ncbi:MAG: response regulator [Synechococcales cyanobacterium M58_A2018_015]|nr:response regulator [Synechococcales cyanobacterium M58_A2018_015]